jgi:hypothetical protein
MSDMTDLPIYKSAISMRALRSGVYVFTGSSAATFTLPNINPSIDRAPDARIQYFKNEGTAQLTLTPNSGNFFEIITLASIVLSPGESVVVMPTNGFYDVLARVGVPKLPTASIPAWNAVYVGLTVFDTTANKLKIAGAAAWETVTSV